MHSMHIASLSWWAYICDTKRVKQWEAQTFYNEKYTTHFENQPLEALWTLWSTALPTHTHTHTHTWSCAAWRSWHTVGLGLLRHDGHDLLWAWLLNHRATVLFICMVHRCAYVTPALYQHVYITGLYSTRGMQLACLYLGNASSKKTILKWLPESDAYIKMLGILRRI